MHNCIGEGIMNKRGRPSQEALYFQGLSIHPGLKSELPGERPEPPAELTQEEAQEWQEIVTRMPPGWFTRETWPVLVQLCRNICTARKVAEVSEVIKGYKFKGTGSGQWVRKVKEVAELQMKLAGSIGSLSTKLRLTQQSKYETSKVAGEQAAKASPGLRPWDVCSEVDRDGLLRSGGEAAWAASEAGSVAEDGTAQDIRQRGRN